MTAGCRSHTVLQGCIRVLGECIGLLCGLDGGLLVEALKCVLSGYMKLMVLSGRSSAFGIM